MGAAYSTSGIGDWSGPERGLKRLNAIRLKRRAAVEACTTGIPVTLVGLGGQSWKFQAPADTNGIGLKDTAAVLADVPPHQVRLINGDEVIADYAYPLKSVEALEISLMLLNDSPIFLASTWTPSSGVVGASGIDRWLERDRATGPQLQLRKVSSGYGDSSKTARADHGVTCMAVDFPSRRALTGGTDTTVRLWDLDTLECVDILDFTEHWISRLWSTRPITYSALREEGEPPVAGMLYCRAKANGWTDYDTPSEWPCPLVACVVADWDGGCAVSGGADATLRLWDLNSASCIQTLQGHAGGVRCVAVNFSDQEAVSGSDDGDLRVWSLDSGACAKTWHAHTKVQCLSVDWVGRRVLSSSGHSEHTGDGCLGGVLKLWEMESGLCLAKMIDYQHSIVCMTVDWARKQVLTTPEDGMKERAGMGLKLWCLEAGKCIQQFQGHGGSPVHSVHVDWDSRLALTAGNDNSIRLWELDARTDYTGLVPPKCKQDANTYCIVPDRVPGPWAFESSHPDRFR